ncbi:hypothetical protein HanIR_Chr07g0338821 [Helianthus annuus]|nr:hypothetical protein HanIR_Chr07g0338821 [Helianthus annuus]
MRPLLSSVSLIDIVSLLYNQILHPTFLLPQQQPQHHNPLDLTRVSSNDSKAQRRRGAAEWG